MPPVLVQSANVSIGNNLAGTVTLPAAPTPGNLLVLHTWVRAGNAHGMPAGFTLAATRAAPVVAAAWRRVVAGDPAAWESPLANERRLFLAEWSGLAAPDAFVTGSLANTNPTNIPVGPGMAIGVHAVDADIAGREVHVIAPSTVAYQAWVNLGGHGPWGSVGHKAGSLDLQATTGAISFHTHGYLIGNYPDTTAAAAVVGVHDHAGVQLTTIDAVDWRVRIEHDGPGSGHVIIARSNPNATEANFARGNTVRVTIPAIGPNPIFEFFIEEGDFDLISSDEEGGEELSFGGPGTLTYLDYARLWYEAYTALGTAAILPAEDVWRFTNRTPGAMVRYLIEEANARPNWENVATPVLPRLTYNFGAVNDSAGVAWTALAGTYEMPMGASVLDETLKLVRQDLAHVRMAPGMVLSMTQGEPGTDRTALAFGAGKIRFVKGVNIADELGRKSTGRIWASHAITKTKTGYIRVGKAAGTFPYRKEVYLDLSGTTDTNSAARAAAGEFLHAEEAQQALIFAHPVPLPGASPDDATGLYLPGPPGSANGRYWVGDLVTLHTGTGQFDYADKAQRVYAITLMPDETGALAPPIVELNAPWGGAEAGPSGRNIANGSSPAWSGGGGGGSNPHAHAATSVSLADAANNTVATEVEGAIADLYAKDGFDAIVMNRAARDTRIRRLGAGEIVLDTNGVALAADVKVLAPATRDAFASAVGAVGQSARVRAYLSGDTAERASLAAGASAPGGAAVLFGSGGAVPDTNLYRAAADVLRTDDTFAIGGFLRTGGTTFPGGPVTGDRFWRTDRAIEYFWDGTRWLSVTLHRETLGVGDTLFGATASPVVTGRWTPWHSTYDLWLVAFYATNYVVGPNNATNHWTVALRKTDAANVPTTVASYTTAADVQDNWTSREVAIGALLGAPTTKQMEVGATKTAAPGGIYVPTAFTYRLVG